LAGGVRPPDGYTVLYAGSTHSINSLLFHNLPYDSIKDFAPVTTMTRSQYVLVLHPSVAANSLQEFIALAKSKPGQLSYETSGTGNPNHLAMVLTDWRVLAPLVGRDCVSCS